MEWEQPWRILEVWQLNEEKICCICNEPKKFLGRINTGKKYYCIQCQTKITREYGQDYWKPCSFEDFMESMLDSMSRKENRRKANMFSSIKDEFRKFDSESTKIGDEK